MRILAVSPGPDFSVHDVYVGWMEALASAGHKVLQYNLNDRLVFYDNCYIQHLDQGDGTWVFKKALIGDDVAQLAVQGLCSMLYKTHPDVLLVVSGFMVPNELLDLARHRGTRVVVLHTESPYEDVRQLEQARHADLNILNDPTNLAKFPDNTLYIPHAYRPALHRPGPAVADYKSDLCFVGTGFASRIRLFEAMDFGGADVFLAGNWKGLGEGSPIRPYVVHDENECMDNTQTVIAYRSAKIGLNYYRREGDDTDAEMTGWAMGPREVEMAAAGLFFLRDPRPEGDDLLPMLPTFTTPGEASDLLAYWLAHPAERAERATAAREAVAPQTFDRNVQVLIDRLERNL